MILAIATICLVIIVSVITIIYVKVLLEFHERDLREEIAKQVKDKCDHMMSCPNEVDTILWIIRGCKNEEERNPHCLSDCTIANCETKKVFVKGINKNGE